MSIIAICPIHNKEVYTSHIDQCLQRFKMVVVNVNDEKPPFDPVAKKFHLGAAFAVNNNMIQPDDVVVFVHEDVMILDNLFPEKIQMIFSEKPEIGMVGVEGISTLSEGYQVGYDVGHYVQGNPLSTVGDGSHVVNASGIGFFPKVSAISSYFFAVRGSLILDGVMPDFNAIPGDKNVYAIDMSIQVMSKGYDVAVADIFMYHGSARLRNTNEIASAAKDYSLVVQKHKSLGIEFPIKGAVVKNNSNTIKIEL